MCGGMGEADMVFVCVLSIICFTELPAHADLHASLAETRFPLVFVFAWYVGVCTGMLYSCVCVYGVMQ